MPTHVDICRVCAHPEAAAIGGALTSGESLRAVSNRYNVTEASAHRHYVWLRLQAARREAAAAERQAAQALVDKARTLCEQAQHSNGSPLQVIQLLRETTRFLVALAEAHIGERQANDKP